jgi:hypothetical protein
MIGGWLTVLTKWANCFGRGARNGGLTSFLSGRLMPSAPAGRYSAASAKTRGGTAAAAPASVRAAARPGNGAGKPRKRFDPFNAKTNPDCQIIGYDKRTGRAKRVIAVPRRRLGTILSLAGIEPGNGRIKARPLGASAIRETARILGRRIDAFSFNFSLQPCAA